MLNGILKPGEYPIEAAKAIVYKETDRHVVDYRIYTRAKTYRYNSPEYSEESIAILVNDHALINDNPFNIDPDGTRFIATEISYLIHRTEQFIMHGRHSPLEVYRAKYRLHVLNTIDNDERLDELLR
jgi:hypothetical protein